MPGLSAPRVTTEAQIRAGFHAAWLLARGREEGLRFTLLSMEGTARSFWAAVFCLLPFLLIRALGDRSAFSAGLPVELIGYSLGWTVFPLASAALVDASRRWPLWPLFIAAWNWTNLAQYAALLGATLLNPLLPTGFGGALTLVAFGYALWLEWFVARAALQLGGGQAVALVALDLVIGLFVHGLVATLSGG